MPLLKVSPDDHAVLINGIVVGHFTRARVQPDTGSDTSEIDTAEGPVGVNVKPGARAKRGSGSVSIRTTSPDLKRLAQASMNGDEVTVSIEVVKNFEAFSYKRAGVTSAILGPVPLGPD